MKAIISKAHYSPKYANQRSSHMRSITQTDSIYNPKNQEIGLYFPQRLKTLEQPTKRAETVQLPLRRTIWRQKQKVIMKAVGREVSHRSSLFSEFKFVANRGSCRGAQIIELRLNKPTDRYMHNMRNIRLAQSILLARPSQSNRRSSLSQFYSQQLQYKKNISRMPRSLVLKEAKGRKMREWVD